MKSDHLNNLVDYVKKYMRNEEKEIVGLTCKLINAKTENPPGDEILAVRIVEDFFQSLKIPYKIFEKTKNRANIVGYIGGQGERPFAPTCARFITQKHIRNIQGNTIKVNDSHLFIQVRYNPVYMKGRFNGLPVKWTPRTMARTTRRVRFG